MAHDYAKDTIFDPTFGRFEERVLRNFVAQWYFYSNQQMIMWLLKIPLLQEYFSYNDWFFSPTPQSIRPQFKNWRRLTTSIWLFFCKIQIFQKHNGITRYLLAIIRKLWISKTNFCLLRWAFADQLKFNISYQLL